ncbi:collagen alpha-1(I) chain-like [Corvus hawaiiensis]|uniref:collagen alpha-1(I) chain-like n=1 Tax=Corvus hawaiiensis TaxID=134902 RepID=UPI0020186CF3|nr:collagen alpha-1(I) chain-like [Corvus hawaiiensis]
MPSVTPATPRPRDPPPTAGALRGSSFLAPPGSRSVPPSWGCCCCWRPWPWPGKASGRRRGQSHTVPAPSFPHGPRAGAAVPVRGVPEDPGCASAPLGPGSRSFERVPVSPRVGAAPLLPQLRRGPGAARAPTGLSGCQ